jgi:hypothetical protein
MKKLCVFGLMSCIIVLPTIASNTFYSATSKQIGGLQIRFPTTAPDGKWRSDQTLTYEVISTNREAILYIPSDSEYLCQIDLFDRSGQTIDKTDLGKKVGSRFETIQISRQHPRYDRPLFVFLNSNKEEVNARQLRTINGGTSAPAFFSPDELFKIEKPGEYKLRLRFQLFEASTNSLSELIRFPPIELSVEK